VSLRLFVPPSVPCVSNTNLSESKSAAGHPTFIIRYPPKRKSEAFDNIAEVMMGSEQMNKSIDQINLIVAICIQGKCSRLRSDRTYICEVR
jgi:hypothetical protein